MISNQFAGKLKSLTFAPLKKHGKFHALKIIKMKKDLHPGNYRMVIFKDMSNGTTFLSRSTAASKEMLKHDDGNEYPVIILFIQVRMYWWILQDVSINLKSVTKKEINNLNNFLRYFSPVLGDFLLA